MRRVATRGAEVRWADAGPPSGPGDDGAAAIHRPWRTERGARTSLARRHATPVWPDGQWTPGAAADLYTARRTGRGVDSGPDGGVAQSVRAAGLYPAGSRFESWLPYHSARRLDGDAALATCAPRSRRNRRTDGSRSVASDLRMVHSLRCSARRLRLVAHAPAGARGCSDGDACVGGSMDRRSAVPCGTALVDFARVLATGRARSRRLTHPGGSRSSGRT